MKRSWIYTGVEKRPNPSIPDTDYYAPIWEEVDVVGPSRTGCVLVRREDGMVADIQDYRLSDVVRLDAPGWCIPQWRVPDLMERAAATAAQAMTAADESTAAAQRLLDVNEETRQTNIRIQDILRAMDPDEVPEMIEQLVEEFASYPDLEAGDTGQTVV